MIINESTNVSTNVTVHSDVQTLHPAIKIYVGFQSLIIIFLNFAVLAVICAKRSKFPDIYWLQIVCLTFNDLLAGFSNFLISLIETSYFKDNLDNCCIIFVFLLSSQSASLYNILGISIHRYVVLKRENGNANVWKHLHTFLCTFFAWAISLSLCSLSVLKFKRKGTDKNTNDDCSFKSILGENVKPGMSVLFGSFILPLILTNVIYFTLLCVLRTRMETINPIETKTTNVKKLTRSNSQANETRALDQISGSTNVREVEKELDPKKVSDKIEDTQEAVELLSMRHLRQPKADTDIIATSSAIKDSDVMTRRKGSTSHSEATVQTQKYSIPQTLLRQRKAYNLLGIILIFLNMCTLPAIVALALASVIDTVYLSRDFLFLLFSTICFNSFVNPIIYTIMLTEFRSVLCEIMITIYGMFRNRIFHLEQ